MFTHKMRGLIEIVKISVVLSSYNHEKYIAESIKSVLNQTYADFELLIFDDGSTDNSQEIIRSFKDNRIKLFLRDRNYGTYYEFQSANKEAHGEYFALHHSDDIWESTKLEKQVQFMDANPEYEVCFAQAKFIDETGELYNLPDNHPYKNAFKQKNRTRAEWLNYLFWNANCFCNPTMFARNKPENFALNPCFLQLPDYYMWIKLLMRKNVYILQEELIKFRLRCAEQNSVSSLSIDKAIRNSNEMYMVAREFMKLTRNIQEFLQVFPEAKEYLVDGQIMAEYAFAQMCLKRNSPAHWKIGLEILYNLVTDANKSSAIEKIYGYNYKKFMSDTGNYDVFGVKYTLSILHYRIYTDFGEGFNENDSVDGEVLIKPAGDFNVKLECTVGKFVKKLRFDPDDNKIGLSIKLLKIIINGKQIKRYSSNAIKIVDDYHVFITTDPYFTIEQEISDLNIIVEIHGLVRNDDITNLQNLYDEVINSYSWKLTKPLRFLTKCIKNILR